jgi:dienelactone hydrolase
MGSVDGKKQRKQDENSPTHGLPFRPETLKPQTCPEDDEHFCERAYPGQESKVDHQWEDIVNDDSKSLTERQPNERQSGESEGPRGNLICLEQVQAASDALTFLAKNPNVEGDRIGMIGSSFGAAIAVYVCGVDKRVAAAISSGGWGDGERKFRGQHPGEAAWKKFTDMLAEGKRHREKTGKSLMVPRYDIVPIPEHLRGHLAQNSILEFTAETAQSMYDFRADDVIGKAAGRPILLLHSSVDSVTPTEQSIEMFKRAGQPCDLHLFAETDHFMFAESNTRVRSVIYDWLDKYFPVRASAAAA